MKAPFLIVLAVVVLGTGSALAIMNNVCKTTITRGALPFPISGTTQRLGAAKFASESQRSDGSNRTRYHGRAH